MASALEYGPSASTSTRFASLRPGNEGTTDSPTTTATKPGVDAAYSAPCRRFSIAVGRTTRPTTLPIRWPSPRCAANVRPNVWSIPKPRNSRSLTPDVANSSTFMLSNLIPHTRPPATSRGARLEPSLHIDGAVGAVDTRLSAIKRCGSETTETPIPVPRRYTSA